MGYATQLWTLMDKRSKFGLVLWSVQVTEFVNGQRCDNLLVNVSLMRQQQRSLYLFVAKIFYKSKRWTTTMDNKRTEGWKFGIGLRLWFSSTEPGRGCGLPLLWTLLDYWNPLRQPVRLLCHCYRISQYNPITIIRLVGCWCRTVD